MRVREYLLENGKSPYQEWFDELDATAAAKVAVAKVRMEAGNTSSIKWFAGIGEYKIDFGPGYRIYLAKRRRRPHHFIWRWNKKVAGCRHCERQKIAQRVQREKKQSPDEKKKRE